jgi:Peptidase M50B-like
VRFRGVIELRRSQSQFFNGLFAMNNRQLRTLLIVATLGMSWLSMQGVHEFGHMLHAWTSGGRVTRVVLAPLEISRTDVSPNPHPMLVAWGGPVWGCVIPVGLWVAVRAARWPRAWWLRFFAGFCLVANGAYLLAGAFFPVGDAESLIRAGTPTMALVAFGAATIIPGFALWNGLGTHFGFAGKSSPAVPIDRRAAYGATAAFAAILVAECGFH